MSRRAGLLSVVVLFVASLLMRAPLLHRTLDSDDWLTLHTLLTISIWNTTGLKAAHYSLVMTWPNDADRFISYAGVEDTKGNTYFVSFPPFAFLMAFAFFNFFHLTPSAVWLKLINLALLLPATLCLYLALEKMFPTDRILLGRCASVLGVALFLFDPNVLFSLGSSYFPLILIVPLWIISVFLYCSIQDSPRLNFTALVGFFALLFIMCYSDWLGFVAAGTFALGAIFGKTARYTNIWLATVSVAAPLAAGTLVVFQYASIGGLHVLLAAVASRFQDRAGVSAQSDQRLTLWNLHTYIWIMKRYMEQHVGLLLMNWGLACLWLISGSRHFIIIWTKEARRLLLLFGLPVFVDHLLLVNHTAIHNYANLKATPLLSVVFVLLLCGAVSYVSRRAGDHEGWSIVAKPLMRSVILTVIACIISVAAYIKLLNDRIAPLYHLGQAIRHLAQDDQVVFLMKRDANDFVSPQLIYFSGRNIQMIADDRQAGVFLKEHQENQGIVFHATEGGDLVGAPVVVGPAP